MKRERCQHLTATDHTTGERVGDRPVWRCSGCGVTSVWRDGWAYFGNIECRRCGEADIESVHCPSCAERAVPVAPPEQRRRKAQTWDNPRTRIVSVRPKFSHVRGRQGYLIHRVTSAQTHLRDGNYSHTAISAACGMTFYEPKCAVGTPEDLACINGRLCWRCEGYRRAVDLRADQEPAP